ncbi:MAG: fumarylacetoacetase [Acidimicrobiia bacterium]|nr:fumarylacetoacetase [Acidimicrobiia bacterium]NNL69257.1 fumarylacetoacetase [Acidimicrobiia bacterium]
MPGETLFPIQNLPFGVFRRPGDVPRVGVAIGNHVVDLAVLADADLLSDAGVWRGAYFADSLNPLLSEGRTAVGRVRARLTELLEIGNREMPDRPGLVDRALVDRTDVELLVPIRPGDYVDFYSSLHHATNLGRLFRPDGDPLLPNWRHIPIGYHGRSSSVVVSGTDITRPSGQLKAPDGPPRFGPTGRLDIELEVGFVTGDANPLGETIDVADAEDHIIGLLLVNDWSARDIQAWEYQPLGPFLGKSFATSVSPWLVTLDALEPFRVPAPDQDPPPLSYLEEKNRRGIDLHLEVAVATPDMPRPHVISRTNFRDMYWTMAQQFAHMTSNGTPVRAGDLYASGTVSGPEPDSFGSLIELTRNGADPLTLPSGETRSFLDDGDTVILRGVCEREGHPRIGLGEVRGTITPGDPR